MADEDQAQLLFDDCRVPKDNVLVTGNAFGRLIRIYNRNRLSGVAQALGMATASYEDALRHVQMRRQFGRELADFQGLQWMLADMAIQLNACRATLYQAAASRTTTASWIRCRCRWPKSSSPRPACACATWRSSCSAATATWPNRRSTSATAACAAPPIYGGTMQIHRNMIAARVLGRRNDQRRRSPGR